MHIGEDAAEIKTEAVSNDVTVWMSSNFFKSLLLLLQFLPDSYMICVPIRKTLPVWKEIFEIFDFKILGEFF